MSAAEILTTQWASTTEPHGRRQRVNVPRWVAEPLEGAHDKQALPGWAPVTFTGDTRKKAAVEAVHALGIEDDTGATSPDALRAIWDDFGGIAHTTWSATPAAPRWRIVLELSRPLTSAEHVKVWGWVNRYAASRGQKLDSKARDASRLWFVAAVPPSGYFETVRFEGEPLDVDAILAEPEPPPKRAAPPPSGARRSSPDERRARAQKYLAKMPPAVQGLDGSGALMAAAREMVRGFDLDPAIALDLLRSDYNPRCSPPWSEAELQHKVDDADNYPGDRGYRLNQGSSRSRIGGEHAANDDGRPVVQVGPDIYRVASEAIEALGLDPEIYQRSRELVQVPTTGEPEIASLPLATLRERLARVASFERFDGRLNDGEGGWRPCAPPRDIAEAVLARRYREGIRTLSGIIETPTMRPDGSILDRPGYDDATGYLYAPSIAFETVPDKPTQADANRALMELCEVWRDFPFENEPAFYVPVAALLTQLARPAIAGAVPAFLFSAATPGTGKTLAADAVAMIATGRKAGRATFPIGRNADEETPKVLGGIASRGLSAVLFDNLPDGWTLESSALEGAITAGSIAYRPLGKSDFVEATWRTVAIATGNNIVIAGALRRRFIVSRMVSKEEHPEERTGYHHPDLLAWAGEHRARLVRAALTILRAYVVAGRPKLGLGLGSFEEWAALVAGAILYAGGVDVVSAVSSKDEQAATPTEGAVRVLFEKLHKLDKAGRGMKAAEIIAAGYGGLTGPRDEELKEAIETLCNQRKGEEPSARRLGQYLTPYTDRVFDGLVLRKHLDRKQIALWSAEPVTE